MSYSRLLPLLIVAGSSPAFALPILFGGWGAGQFGVVAVTPVVNLSGNVSTPGGNQDAVIAVAAGVDLALSAGTVTGAIDFADAATKGTGGSCPSDPGGVCRVNTNSAFTGGTVTGVTLQYNAAVVNAVDEWNALTNATNWGSTTGAMAVNLGSSALPYVLCAGNGQSGCTSTNTTTITRIVNGQTQTAYVFDISGTTGGIVNQNVTIKGDGTALVILLYSNTAANALNVAKNVSLSGLTADQVLLNVTSTKGITTGSGFNFTGAVAVAGAAETLTSAVIAGRLFLNGSGPANISGIALTATADIATPEPGTEFLIGGALVLLGVVAKLRKRA